MRVISGATLREFWEQPKFADAEQSLIAWYYEVKHANWQTLQDIMKQYRNASCAGGNLVVFNIHGNRYRLITAINFDLSMVYVRFIGTQADYDKVDSTTV